MILAKLDHVNTAGNKNVCDIAETESVRIGLLF